MATLPHIDQRFSYYILIQNSQPQHTARSLSQRWVRGTGNRAWNPSKDMINYDLQAPSTVPLPHPINVLKSLRSRHFLREPFARVLFSKSKLCVVMMLVLCLPLQ